MEEAHRDDRKHTLQTRLVLEDLPRGQDRIESQYPSTQNLQTNSCMHAGGRAVACSGELHPVGATGGANRLMPVGGAAKGIPR